MTYTVSSGTLNPTQLNCGVNCAMFGPAHGWSWFYWSVGSNDFYPPGYDANKSESESELMFGSSLADKFFLHTRDLNSDGNENKCCLVPWGLKQILQDSCRDATRFHKPSSTFVVDLQQQKMF